MPCSRESHLAKQMTPVAGSEPVAAGTKRANVVEDRAIHIGKQEPS